MTGGCTDAQIGALLMGLRMKGESIDEITAAAEVMRELAIPVDVDVEPLVDIVGTGGDGASLFNISSASAFVVAAAGGHVAKHGNRGVSSASGSADALEHLGVKLGMPAAMVARGIRELRVGFMFAPAHHGAMRHAIGPRRELGMRTLFNILGPLTNPAGARRLLVGTFSRACAGRWREVLAQLGARHVLVVHAERRSGRVQPGDAHARRRAARRRHHRAQLFARGARRAEPEPDRARGRLGRRVGGVDPRCARQAPRAECGEGGGHHRAERRCRDLRRAASPIPCAAASSSRRT